MSHVEAQMSSCVPFPQGREDRSVHLRLGLPVAGLLECALSFCILNVCVCVHWKAECQWEGEWQTQRERGLSFTGSYSTWLQHLLLGQAEATRWELAAVPPWGWQGPHLLPPLTCTRKLVGSDAAGTWTGTWGRVLASQMVAFYATSQSHPVFGFIRCYNSQCNSKSTISFWANGELVRKCRKWASYSFLSLVFLP